MKRISFVLLFFLSITGSASNQDSIAAPQLACLHISDSLSLWSMNINVHTGLLLPEYGFVNYLSQDYVHGLEVNIRKQTFGKTYWDQLYRYPAWGVSFFMSTMGNSNVFGNQFSIYPYYMLNIFNRKRISLSYQMGIGVSYSTKLFDIENNFENVAIGSHLNIHYHADFFLRTKWTDRIGSNLGISFNHISNANLSEPNVGLNFVTVNAGISLGLGKMQVKKEVPCDPFIPEHHFSIYLNGGIKHTRTFESFRYPAFSAMLEYTRRTKYKVAFGAGLDFFYDSSVESQLARLGKPFKSTYSCMSGLHLSQEFIYNRVSAVLQEGIYLGFTDKLNHRPIYNRVIVRWQLSSHFSVNMCLKSYLYILDFPEIGIGYKF